MAERAGGGDSGDDGAREIVQYVTFGEANPLSPPSPQLNTRTTRSSEKAEVPFNQLFHIARVTLKPRWCADKDVPAWRQARGSTSIYVRATSLVSIVLSSIVLNRQPFQERPRSSDGVCWDRLHPLHDLVLYKEVAGIYLTWTFFGISFWILYIIYRFKPQKNKLHLVSMHLEFFFTPLSCLCLIPRHTRSFLPVAIKLYSCSLGG